jgi:alkylhydroperoxidase family enzyme
LGENYREAGLSPKPLTMLEFAEFLTTNPSGVSQEWADGLRDVGWADEDIVDMVHITALFNYMDRVADGLVVELDLGRNWEGLTDRLSFKDDTAPKVFGKIAAPGA